MDSESITLTEKGQVQCLEEEAVGEVEERPIGKESAGGVGNQTTKEENKIYRFEEQSTTAAVQSSSQSSISCVPDSVENQVEEKMSEMVEGKSVAIMAAEVPEKINETSEYKSVKETLKSDQVFSENIGSEVLCIEIEDTPLLYAHRTAALENSRATDNVPIQESGCENTEAVPDDVLPKAKGKRKTFSLEASLQAREKMLCVSESSLSERTTDSTSREESQCRDSMAAPADLLLKPKAKRKTFSLEASPRTDKKMNNYSLPTDSIDIEQVIGEAVLGMLGKTGASASADDDLSMQEIEMHEAVWKSGQTAKRNSLGCAVSRTTCVLGNSQSVPAVVKTGVILVNETESGSTEVIEEKVESELNSRVTAEVVNCGEVVSRGNKELLLDHSSESVEERIECTRALIESSCAKAETQTDRKSECIVVGTDDSSSVNSNSYSLLPPPVSVAQNKNCADLRLKDSSVKVQHSTNSLQSMCLDSCQIGDESLPDVESEHFVEAKGLTGLKSEELKVDDETKSQCDLVSISKIEREVTSEAETCPINYLKAKMEADLENQSEVQNESNLVMESVPRADPNVGSDLTSINEQNLSTESSDIRKSLENLAHQLSSTCEPGFQTEEIHAKSGEDLIQDATKIEEPETFVNGKF